MAGDGYWLYLHGFGLAPDSAVLEAVTRKQARLTGPEGGVRMTANGVVTAEDQVRERMLEWKAAFEAKDVEGAMRYESFTIDESPGLGLVLYTPATEDDADQIRAVLKMGL
jgi:hypothetical protein